MPTEKELAGELAALEAYLARATGQVVPYCPHTPTERQRAFLTLDALEALYGGAAGGGKSDALLMAGLQHVDVPGYSALLLRRTFADLSLPGAIMERSKIWLANTDAHWNERDKVWTFPSGAKLQFGFCETRNDVYRYLGAEFQFIGIDELTQWEEITYRYLLSRLRRPRVGALSKVPLRMRGATNPGGIGFDWVKNRFGMEASGEQRAQWTEKRGEREVQVHASERPFIPSRIPDNPHLDAETYIANLELLDSTTRDQLLLGMWVQDAAGRVYRFERGRNLIPALPPRLRWNVVLGVDLGASERRPTTGFALLLWHDEEKHKVYCAESRVKALLTPTDIAKEVERYFRMYPEIEIVVDQGGLGIGYLHEFERRWSLPVYKAEKRNKLGYRKLLNGALERGDLLLVDGANNDLVHELETLIWDDTGTDVAKGLPDHASDALLYAWRRARAYASEAPTQPPQHGTLEWWEAEAARLEREDRDRFKKNQDRSDWEKW